MHSLVRSISLRAGKDRGLPRFQEAIRVRSKGGTSRVPNRGTVGKAWKLLRFMVVREKPSPSEAREAAVSGLTVSRRMRGIMPCFSNIWRDARYRPWVFRGEIKGVWRSCSGRRW
jgi:hypothetical protein